jgi:hypothetical protein
LETQDLRSYNWGSCPLGVRGFESHLPHSCTDVFISIHEELIYFAIKLNLSIHFQEIDYSYFNNQDLIDIHKKNMPPFLMINIDNQLQSKIVT